MQTSNDIFLWLKKELNDLPGEEAHYEMYPKRGISSEALKNATSYKTSAVLALLYQDQGTKMVLTQRHEYEGKHSGQVSFPGGKMEAHDPSVIHTALRETEEEIGINSEHVNILGKLTDVYIPVSQFLVHPFLGYHEGKPQFQAEEKEVKEIFSFDINLLLRDETLQFRDIQQGKLVLKDIPCFIIENKVVWGATALMLNEFKSILKRL